MKKIKISTFLLALSLFTMSMGFPYKSSSEQNSVKINKGHNTYAAAFMSCSVQQPESMQKIKPIIKDCTDMNEAKCKIAGNIAGQSALVIYTWVNEKR